MATLLLLRTSDDKKVKGICNHKKKAIGEQGLRNEINKQKAFSCKK